MGRRRKHNKHLPNRVYKRGKRHYFYPPDAKPIPLGESLSEMYENLSRILGAPQTTMNALFARYEKGMLPRKARATQKLQRGQIERLRRSFGHMEISALRTTHIWRYHQLRGEQSIVQANRELSLFKHIVKMALAWDYRQTNPATSVQRHPEKPRNRYVTDRDVAAMAGACEGRAPYVAVLMDLAILTGQRKRDLLTLTRRQLTSDGIEFTQSKTGKRLLVEWTPALRRAVQGAIKLHGGVSHIHLIVNARGEPLTESAFNTMWGKVQRELAAAGEIERFTFHDLRAKAGSESGDYRLLGHSSERTFKRVYMRIAEHVKPTR